jgi:hypothetical protein
MRISGLTTFVMRNIADKSCRNYQNTNDQQVKLHPTKPPDLHPQPQAQKNQSSHNLQPVKNYKCTQLTPKTASVVPPEDGRLTPETCGGSRHNKAIVKAKLY